MKKIAKHLKRRLEYFFKSKFFSVTNAQALMLGLKHVKNHTGSIPHSLRKDIYGNLWDGSQLYTDTKLGLLASLTCIRYGFKHFGNLDPELAEKVGYRSVWHDGESSSKEVVVKGVFFYDK